MQLHISGFIAVINHMYNSIVVRQAVEMHV